MNLVPISAIAIAIPFWQIANGHAIATAKVELIADVNRPLLSRRKVYLLCA